MKDYAYIESPLGSILLTSNGAALTGLYFAGQKYEAVIQYDWIEDLNSPLFASAKAQLLAYFEGRRTRFDVPLVLHGTPFQLRIWRTLATIAHATTLSYRALAETAGTPQSVRAAASAVGRNPISIILPCHRVIGSDGSLTGYAGGLERKRALLDLEASSLSRQSVEQLRWTKHDWVAHPASKSPAM